MQKQAERMSRLIDDLLSLSRLEMRAHLAVNECVDMTAVLNHVADTLSPLAAGLDVTIERHLPDHPVNVTGTRDELIQVFQIWLRMPVNMGRAVSVILKLDEENNGGASEAVASALGFLVRVLPLNICHVSQSASIVSMLKPAVRKREQGWGLRSSYILARHRGRLVVRSQLGEGSTFLVRLPKRT